MAEKSADRLPAHRPSRRNEIIDAAIRQFARKGFVDTTIADVAEEVDVVVTAVYYHFSSKEELFSAAVNRVFASVSSVVAAARPDEHTPDKEGLYAVIDAVWAWIDTHPDEATLLYLQLPGATRQITTLRQEFEEQHVQRGLGYFSGDRPQRRTAARRATETLMSRTMVDLLMAVHTMRMADGPLSKHSSRKLREAVHELADRMLTA